MPPESTLVWIPTRRTRLSAAVAKMAHQIDTGAITTSVVELDALAQLCDAHQLPIEAARVRRWIDPNAPGDPDGVV